jgi:hypothetical protein
MALGACCAAAGNQNPEARSQNAPPTSAHLISDLLISGFRSNPASPRSRKPALPSPGPGRRRWSRSARR